MGNALITGCSTGFGLLTAVELARRGHTVHASMRDLAKQGRLLDAAAAEGVDVHVVELDVRDEGSVRAAVDAASADGPIDVLVNNAGIELRAPVELAVDDEVLTQFDTNVFGLLRLVRAVVPGMRTRGEGVVVNVGSIAGLVARPFGGLYAASKHAVEAITDTLHYELRPFGVRAHVIEPGQFATELLANALHARAFTPDTPYWASSESLDAAMGRLVPNGEPGDPHAVAVAIADVIDDPAAPVHVVVGADAEMIVAARRESTFEEFEQAMRAVLDWWD